MYEHCPLKWFSAVKFPHPWWVEVNVVNLVLKTTVTKAVYSSRLTLKVGRQCFFDLGSYLTLNL